MDTFKLGIEDSDNYKEFINYCHPSVRNNTAFVGNQISLRWTTTSTSPTLTLGVLIRTDEEIRGTLRYEIFDADLKDFSPESIQIAFDSAYEDFLKWRTESIKDYIDD